MDTPVSDMPRSLLQAVLRGIAGKCPNCGRGKLFGAFLKVAPRCAVCQHHNGQYLSDDGPAYFTILIVSFVVIVPIFVVSVRTDWPTMSILSVFVPAVILASFGLLPRVKGAFIGAQWAASDGQGV